MDSNISVRFFRVSQPAPAVSDFAEILQTLAVLPPADRERVIGRDVTVRLERCAERGDTVEGEFCRVQNNNFPPQAGQEGLRPIRLDEGHGLGHVAAFIYHRPTRVLALQSAPQSMTVNRLAAYVAADDPMRIHAFNPVLSDDAIERFTAGRARSFTVKFAGLDRLDAFDGAEVTTAQGARMIAEAYDGVEVEIKVSVGRRRGVSLTNVIPSVMQMLQQPSVQKLEAKLEGDAMPLDLMHEQLHATRSLNLPEHDPQANYAVRNAYVREQLQAHMPLLLRQFAAQQG